MDATVEKHFYEHLRALGFPATAIVFQPGFRPMQDGRRFRPDFAALDPETKEPVAIIELKSSDRKEVLHEALKQVNWYTAQLQAPSVRSYVASPAASGGFDFYQLGEDGNPKRVDPSFVAALSLSSAKSAERNELLAEKKKRTIDSFFIVCYCAATLALFLAAADFILKERGLTLLTAERLALLAVAAGLVIVPFLQKFKALGVEIERQAGKSDG